MRAAGPRLCLIGLEDPAAGCYHSPSKSTYYIPGRLRLQGAEALSRSGISFAENPTTKPLMEVVSDRVPPATSLRL